MHEYTLIRSKRRTLSIQIGKGGQLIARAPQRMSLDFIERFILEKQSWIEKYRSRVISRESSIEKKIYTVDEVHMMKEGLKIYLIERVRELWRNRGLPEYTSLKVTKSERRWGSCSGKNGLCFSYRLAEYLPILLSSRSDPFEYHPGNTNDLLGEGKRDFSYRRNDKGTDFIDAIIYHELAHLREKNHGPKFWGLVYQMMPEYERVMRGHRGDTD